MAIATTSHAAASCWSQSCACRAVRFVSDVDKISFYIQWYCAMMKTQRLEETAMRLEKPVQFPSGPVGANPLGQKGLRMTIYGSSNTLRV